MADNKIIVRPLWLLIAVLSITFFLPSSGMTVPPKGEVVFATVWQSFLQVGGDPATQMAGNAAMSRALFDSLITVDVKRNYLPSLAKGWKFSSDGKFIDFNLRDDVTFHNGDKFTAEDVKFSIETYLRKELRFTLAGFFTKAGVRVEIIAPYKVRIHMDTPYPLFFQHLWWGTGMMPKKYREKVGDRGFADKPIGTGPYKMVEFKQDAYWKAEAVKNHFRHTPEIKTIRVIYAPDHPTRMAMLKAGEADIAEINPPNVPEVQSDPNYRIVLNKYTHLAALIYADLDKPEPSPFKDIRIREAASLAIDREGITKKILFGMAEPYGDFCSPITLGHDPKIKPDPYDPQRARKLLAEAGYANGFDTSIIVVPYNKFWMEAVAANLNEVGIRARVEVMEQAQYMSKLVAKNLKGIFMQMLWYGPSRSASGDAMTHFLNPNPYAYNSTPEIEKEILRGNNAHTDKEMAEAGRRLSKVIRESRIKTFLWANFFPYALGPRIEYWEPELAALPPSSYELIRLKKSYL